MRYNELVEHIHNIVPNISYISCNINTVLHEITRFTISVDVDMDIKDHWHFQHKGYVSRHGDTFINPNIPKHIERHPLWDEIFVDRKYDKQIEDALKPYKVKNYIKKL